MDFRDIDKGIITKELLVSVFDIDNFISLARELEGKSLFGLVNELAQIASEHIQKANGYIVKYIGDSALIIFDEKEIDSGLKALFTLKIKLEEHLRSKGYNNTISFSANCGPVIVGYIGKEPFKYLDILGDSVEMAFRINGKPLKGSITVTETVFEKLSPNTKKMFQEFMPTKLYYLEKR